MELKKEYMINQHLMYMVGYHDRYGKLCTLVQEENETFFVDCSPLEILAYSIRCIGFDYKGALETSKWILGDEILMHPVMVNPILNICLFPTRSPNRPDTIWFNPFYIKRTIGCQRKTMIEYRNGKKMLVHMQLSAFNNRLQTAEQFRNLTVGIGMNPFSFDLNPKKRRPKRKRKSMRRRA
ncbi:competence protein ComK [Pseudoneobacillus sp. C159]